MEKLIQKKRGRLPGAKSKWAGGEGIWQISEEVVLDRHTHSSSTVTVERTENVVTLQEDGWV